MQLKFLDDNGFLRQIDSRKVNYIDTNFLTTNTIYQKIMLGDIFWYDKSNIESTANKCLHMLYRNGKIIRYYKNFPMLIGTSTLETIRYTDYRTVSRDNSMGYLILAGHMGQKDKVKKFMWDTLLRFSFFQNTLTVKGERKLLPDLCGPSQWSVLLRAGFTKPSLILMYPLLLVLDFFYMLSYIFHVARSYTNPSHTSTVHHMLSAVIQAKKNVPTVFTYIAEKVFKMRKQVTDFKRADSLTSAMSYYSRQTYDPKIEHVTVRVVEDLL